MKPYDVDNAVWDAIKASVENAVNTAVERAIWDNIGIKTFSYTITIATVKNSVNESTEKWQ